MFQAKMRHARLTVGPANPSICSLLSIGVCLKDKAVTTGLHWTPTIESQEITRYHKAFAIQPHIRFDACTCCSHTIRLDWASPSPFILLSDPSTALNLHRSGLGALLSSQRTVTSSIEHLRNNVYTEDASLRNYLASLSTKSLMPYHSCCCLLFPKG